jgi:hypothetical protein
MRKPMFKEPRNVKENGARTPTMVVDAPTLAYMASPYAEPGRTNHDK